MSRDNGRLYKTIAPHMYFKTFQSVLDEISFSSKRKISLFLFLLLNDMRDSEKCLLYLVPDAGPKQEQKQAQCSRTLLLSPLCLKMCGWYQGSMFEKYVFTLPLATTYKSKLLPSNFVVL